MPSCAADYGFAVATDIAPQPIGSPEDVAYWFFRLNGCLTIRNFVVHPERRGSQLTDADLLAVRFQWRSEQNLIDHWLFDEANQPRLFLVEVKTGGACRLNGPWTDKSGGNLTRLLEAIGCFHPDEVSQAAEALHRVGRYGGGTIEALLVAIASRRSDELAQVAASAIQLTWDEILNFIFNRFRAFRAKKAHHPQWDSQGRSLYKMAQGARNNFDAFGESVEGVFFGRTESGLPLRQSL